MMSILILLLMAGIAFLHSRHGLFTSIILMVCTLVAAMISLNTYSWLASVTTLAEHFPLLADPICLSVLFGAILIGLRVGTDLLIKGDVFFKPLVDRIGGAVVGVVSGIFMTGVLLVVVQMLPLPASILGYQPFGDDLQRQSRILPFSNDDFVLSLAEAASDGCLGTEPTFEQGHPDLLRQLQCERNTAGLGVGRECEEKQFLVEGLYEVYPVAVKKEGEKPISDKAFLKANKLNFPTNKRLGSSVGKKDYVCRVKIHLDVTNDNQDWLLPATQFRLVAAPVDDKGKLGQPVSFYPTAYMYYDKTGKIWKLETAGGNRNALAVQRPSDVAKYDDLIAEFRRRDAELKKNKKKTKYLKLRKNDEILRKPAKEEVFLEVDWVYQLPKNFKLLKMVFRKTAERKLLAPKGNLSTYAKDLQVRALKTKPQEPGDKKKK